MSNTVKEAFTDTVDQVANPLGVSYEDELYKKHHDILEKTLKVKDKVKEALGELEGCDELKKLYYDQIIPSLKKIQNKVIRIVTCGASGHGKSFTVNALLVSKDHLRNEFKLDPETYYGKYPIPSREGYQDVTCNNILATYSENWSVALILVKAKDENLEIEEVPNLNLLEKLKDLGLDEKIDEHELIQMEAVLHWISSRKDSRNKLAEMVPRQFRASVLNEVNVKISGPFLTNKNIEIVDTPGYSQTTEKKTWRNNQTLSAEGRFDYSSYHSYAV